MESGELLTIHCPNTGSMKNCQPDNARIWFSTSANPKRKYPHTWELVELEDSSLVGINTGLANSLVVEAIENEVVPQLQGYGKIRTEVAYGEQNSRIDILLQDFENSARADCYIEVKNVSLGLGDGLGLFPDAVTSRGQKHLQELMHMRSQGYRSVLFFCVQHTGIERVSPADEIDPRYGELLRQAMVQGVEVMAYSTEFNTAESSLHLVRELQVDVGFEQATK